MSDYETFVNTTSVQFDDNLCVSYCFVYVLMRLTMIDEHYKNMKEIATAMIEMNEVKSFDYYVEEFEKLINLRSKEDAKSKVEAIQENVFEDLAEENIFRDVLVPDSEDDEP